MTVQIGTVVAALEVALIGCPLPVTAPKPPVDLPTIGAGMVLVPGAGLDGNAYDGPRRCCLPHRLPA